MAPEIKIKSIPDDNLPKEYYCCIKSYVDDVYHMYAPGLYIISVNEKNHFIIKTYKKIKLTDLLQLLGVEDAEKYRFLYRDRKCEHITPWYITNNSIVINRIYSKYIKYVFGE